MRREYKFELEFPNREERVSSEGTSGFEANKEVLKALNIIRIRKTTFVDGIFVEKRRITVG